VRVAEEFCEQKFGGSSVLLKTKVETIKNLFELLVTPTVLLVDDDLQQFELGARLIEVC
jgi:hypothetical protein